MRSELFAELLAAANDALQHSKGKRDLRTTSLPRQPDPMTATEVRRLRARLQASQALLARYLNVSTKLVQAWEAEERTPSGPALVLLRLLEKQPAILDTIDRTHEATNRRPVKRALPRKVTAR